MSKKKNEDLPADHLSRFTWAPGDIQFDDTDDGGNASDGSRSNDDDEAK